MIARLLLPAALLLAAAPAAAQRMEVAAPLPPAPAWRGASERLIAPRGHAWITPAEATEFETTPSYAETRAYIERLVAASPLLRIEPFGRSSEGRELYAVVASRDDGRARPYSRADAFGPHAGAEDEA